MKKSIYALILTCVFLVSVSSALAQASPTTVGQFENPIANGQASNPTGGLFARPNTTQIGFPNLITRFSGGDFAADAFGFILDILTTIGGIVAFAYLIYGGVKFITSGGNPASVEEGKKIIIGSVVGVLIIAVAYVLVVFVRNQLIGTG